MKQFREPQQSFAGKVKAMPMEKVRELTNSLTFKTEPKEHQLRALIIGMAKSTWMFAADMGLGKTKMAIDIISLRKSMNEVKRVLVSCPPVVQGHWAREVIKHSDLDCLVVQGTDPAFKMQLLANSEKDITVVSCNWIVKKMGEALRNEQKYEVMKQILSRYDTLIIDEAHTVRNAKSVGFAGYVRFMQKTKYRYLLTGTPVGNDYTGLWALYYLLDGGETFGRNYEDFLSYWFNATYISRHRYFKYHLKGNLKEKFAQKIWQRAVRWEETECNDLPDKAYVEYEVALTKERDKEYDKIVAQTADAGKMTSVFSLMRVTAGLSVAKSPKMDILDDIIKEVCIQENGKLIIWHWLVEEGQQIEARLRKNFPMKTIQAVRGETSEKEKQSTLDAWRAKKIDIMVANPRSLGIGVDLFEANIAVFFSNSMSLIDRKQAEKRIHRTGQTKRCLYIDLVCKNTVDELVLNNVREAQARFADLTKDELPSEEQDIKLTWDEVQNQRKDKNKREDRVRL